MSSGHSIVTNGNGELIAHGAGGLQLAEHLLHALLVNSVYAAPFRQCSSKLGNALNLRSSALGDELAHLVVLRLQLVGHDEQPEAERVSPSGTLSFLPFRITPFFFFQ